MIILNDYIHSLLKCSHIQLVILSYDVFSQLICLLLLAPMELFDSSQDLVVRRKRLKLMKV